MSVFAQARCLWWLVHKDMTRDVRASQSWPRTLVLGLVLVLLLSTQIELPSEQQADVIGGMLWFAIFFSSTLAIERSSSSEHDDGCWEALLLYPIPSSVVFLAKMGVNFFSIMFLQVVLIPLFIVFSDVPLLARPGPMALIAVLSGAGFAAVGTLIGALTASLHNRGVLLALLMLPLSMPVLISAAEATRILLAPENDPMWTWWIQVMAAFTVAFTVIGALAFDFVMEE